MPDLLLSILLPVKNASTYLYDCIRSILDQSETNWELIAIDDHSDDDSFKVLEKYSAADSRIRVFKNDGKGIIPALRKAYSLSSGQLITRMDADDIMAPNKLEWLKALLLQYGPNHLATGLVKYFSEGELGNGYLKYQNWLNALSLEEKNFLDIYKECVVPSPCWMVFREDLDKCGAFESDTYPEDYDLCFRFYKNGLQVKTVPEVLHHWRDYAARTSRNDPKYSDVHFFDLKMKNFLALNYDKNRPLVLWGAGRKGKELAKALNKNHTLFRWITDNTQKIGHDIYGVSLEPTDQLETIHNPQIIIAVAAPDAISQIYNTLASLHLEKAKDYFFFC